MEEKRKYPRTEVDEPAYVSSGGSVMRCVVRNISQEGAAIAHQVYAAYRRASLVHWQHLFERARRYQPIVEEAAAAFNLDPALVMGVAAAESAFQPRRSTDGGRGLFQITAPPAAVPPPRLPVAARMPLVTAPPSTAATTSVIAPWRLFMEPGLRSTAKAP